MKRYILSTLKNEQGDREVHESSCARLPSYVYQKDLGYHFTCSSAMTAARAMHPTVNGCSECNRACYTVEVEI